MSGDPEFGCTCSNIWLGVIPPQPCPVHAVRFTPAPLPTFTLRTPWKCPRCDTVNAPHVDSCACSSAARGDGVPAGTSWRLG